MTSQELYDNFLLQYDINGSASAVGFTDDEIYAFLTKGQLMIMDAIAANSDIDELQELKITDHLLIYDSKDYGVSNIKKCETIKDMYSFINGTVDVMRSGIISSGRYSKVKIKPIEEKYIGELFVTDYNKPIYEWVYTFMKGNSVYLIHDAYVESFGVANMTYIKLPMNITENITASLNSKYHPSIVDSAVTVALNTVNDVRTKKTNT